LALWAAFQVLDEVFLGYQPEGVHRVIFVSQIVTLMFLHLLTDTPQQAGIGGTGGPEQRIGSGQ
jgi:hypothetical protein